MTGRELPTEWAGNPDSFATHEAVFTLVTPSTFLTTSKNGLDRFSTHTNWASGYTLMLMSRKLQSTSRNHDDVTYVKTPQGWGHAKQ